jgi:hypothetical protein
MGKISLRTKGIVSVGSDVYAPEQVELTQDDVEDMAGLRDIAVNFEAVLMLEGARYVVQDLRFIRREGGAPITSELIRRIPVQRIVRGVVTELAELRTDPGAVYESDGMRMRAPEQVVIPPDERGRLVGAGPTDETLLWVARVYVMATLAGDPPAKAVKENLGIPMPTANNWIRRAKDRGILKQQAPTGEPHPALPKQSPIADPEREKRLHAARTRARERRRAIDAGEIT